LVGSAIAAAAILPGAYLAAGGASYTPAKTQDPCKQRAWGNPEGLQEIGQRFTLVALDGAACKLGVSRETLAQALASSSARERFAERYDLSQLEIARAVRAGLLRAVREAEEAGDLDPVIAEPLRDTLESIPLEEAIDLINDAEVLFDQLQGFLGPAQEFLESLLP